jgi:ABC-type phosphate/phosphonate transport system substrate-binding protein
MRVASFGMYEFAETRDALDAFWAAVASRLQAAGLKDVPLILMRDRTLEQIWRDPELLIAQTCGYPMRKHLSDAVRPVATPVYDVPGCDGPLHRSFIVVGSESSFRTLGDLRGARAAINGYDSNSGMNLFRAALAPIASGRPMFASVIVTGAHAKSFAAVATGAADVAAIDCVSHWFIMRQAPELAARVRVLAETAPSPGLPLITLKTMPDAEVNAIRAALRSALSDSTLRKARETLRLTDFAVLDDAAYDVVLGYEKAAVAAGYPRLE